MKMNHILTIVSLTMILVYAIFHTLALTRISKPQAKYLVDTNSMIKWSNQTVSITDVFP